MPSFFYLFKLEPSIDVVRVYVVDLESLVPYHCGFVSHQGLWILSCKEDIHLVYGTLVVLLRYPLVPEIMYEEAPEVKAGKSPYDLNSVGATQQNKKKIFV